MTTTAEATTATRMTMVLMLMLMLTAMTMMKPTMLQWQKSISFEAVPLDSLGIDALFFGYPLQKLYFMSEF